MRRANLQMLFLAILLILSASLLSCQRRESPGSNRYQLPWPQADGSYQLQPVVIQSMTDSYLVKGPMADIKIEAQFRGAELAGNEPQTHFVQAEDGLLIPKDFESMQAATIYAHVERFHEMEGKLGLSGLLSYPRKIGVGIKLQKDGEQWTNNALYHGKSDILLLVPYQLGDLPITLNGGILAHEHFHAIFQQLFINDVIADMSAEITEVKCQNDDRDVRGDIQMDKPTPENPEEQKKEKKNKIQKFNTLLVRAMNEGFADFWAWVYTGDENFIQASLANQKERRKVAAKMEVLQLAIQKGLMLNSEPAAYALGNYYARAMRMIFAKKVVENSLDSRLHAAKGFLNSLPVLKQLVLSSAKDKNLSMNLPLLAIFQGRETLDEDSCKMLKEISFYENPLPYIEKCKESYPKIFNGTNEYFR